jgi:putative membrane protein
MKIGALVATLLGLALVAVVFINSDMHAVASTLASLGATGFAWICYFFLLPTALCAVAMQTLIDRPRPPLRGIFWARLCRNAGGDLLVFLPGVGEILAIRSLALQGMAASAAAAVVVLDVTTELVAQLLFSLVGFALALSVLDHASLYWYAFGLVLLAVAAATFSVAQRKGLFKLLDGLVNRLAINLPAATAGMGQRIHESLVEMWANPARLAWSTAIHFCAWVLGVGEGWLALAFMGIRAPLEAIVALESLLFAVRSIAFAVPGALGIQEAAYVALSTAFGFTPEALLTVSLIKRARSIALGVPVLVSWQVVEALRARRQPNVDT